MDKTCPFKNGANCDKTCALYVSEMELELNNHDDITMAGCSFKVMLDQIHALGSVISSQND